MQKKKKSIKTNYLKKYVLMINDHVKLIDLNLKKVYSETSWYAAKGNRDEWSDFARGRHLN